MIPCTLLAHMTPVDLLFNTSATTDDDDDDDDDDDGSGIIDTIRSNIHPSLHESNLSNKHSNTYTHTHTHIHTLHPDSMEIKSLRSEREEEKKPGEIKHLERATRTTNKTLLGGKLRATREIIRRVLAAFCYLSLTRPPVTGHPIPILIPDCPYLLHHLLFYLPRHSIRPLATSIALYSLLLPGSPLSFLRLP